MLCTGALLRGERRDLFVRLFARLSAVAARNHVKAEEAAFKRAVEAVSYTHLDVYKRQAASCAVWMAVGKLLRYVVVAAGTLSLV